MNLRGRAFAEITRLLGAEVISVHNSRCSGPSSPWKGWERGLGPWQVLGEDSGEELAGTWEWRCEVWLGKWEQERASRGLLDGSLVTRQLLVEENGTGLESSWRARTIGLRTSWMWCVKKPASAILARPVRSSHLWGCHLLVHRACLARAERKPRSETGSLSGVFLRSGARGGAQQLLHIWVLHGSGTRDPKPAS